MCNTTFVSFSYTPTRSQPCLVLFCLFTSPLFFFFLFFFSLSYSLVSLKKRIIERIKLAQGDSKNYIKVYDCRAEGSCYCIWLRVRIMCCGSLFMEYKYVWYCCISSSSGSMHRTKFKNCTNKRLYERKVYRQETSRINKK